MSGLLSEQVDLAEQYADCITLPPLYKELLYKFIHAGWKIFVVVVVVITCWSWWESPFDLSFCCFVVLFWYKLLRLQGSFISRDCGFLVGRKEAKKENSIERVLLRILSLFYFFCYKHIETWESLNMLFLTFSKSKRKIETFLILFLYLIVLIVF